MSSPLADRPDGVAAQYKQPLGDAAGCALRIERQHRSLSQRALADDLEIPAQIVSLIERGEAEALEFGLVLRVLAAVDLTVVRRRQLVDKRPTDVAELNLSRATLRALAASNTHLIADVGPAAELIQRSEFRSGRELYELACAMNRHGLSLPWGREISPADRDRTMLRLRIIDRLSLKQIATAFDLSLSRVSQRLRLCFGMEGSLPASPGSNA